MTWKPHPRELTQEVFAANGTIDGMRINKAIKEIVDAMNNVDRGYIFEKWVENKVVRNITPVQNTGSATIVHHDRPWLRSFNHVNDIFNTAAGEDADIVNPHREKSYRAEGQPEEYAAAVPPSDATLQYIWSETLFFSAPVILIDWQLILMVEGAGANTGIGSGVFINDWEYGNDDTKPEGVAVGNPRKDFAMLVAIDSPLDLEDRSLSDVVLVRKYFSLREAQISQAGWPAAGWNDGFPGGYPMGAIHGMHQRMPLYLPVHANSRVRFSLVHPFYPDDAGADNRGWNINTASQRRPGQSCTWNQTLHFLEPVENGQD